MTFSGFYPFKVLIMGLEEGSIEALKNSDYIPFRFRKEFFGSNCDIFDGPKQGAINQ